MRSDPPSGLAFFMRIARGAFSRQATYRAAAVGGATANTIVALLKGSVLLAVVAGRGPIGGFDASDLITFAFVSMALDQPVAIFAPIELSQRIRSGDVVVDLFRPADVQLYWFAHEVGRSAFNVMARLAPPILVGGLIFDLRLPANASTWFGFLVSLLAAIVLSFAFRFVLSISTFWTLEANAIPGIANFFVILLSGWLVPLALFPPALAAVARALPFAGLAQLPIEIFLGKHEASGMAMIVLRQVAWAGAFFALGRILLARATRRVVVQGG